MNFRERVRQLIGSAYEFVFLRVCVCVHLCMSHPPTRDDKVPIIFVTAGGKCDLLSHSYAVFFVSLLVAVAKERSIIHPHTLSVLSPWHISSKVSPSPHLSLSLELPFVSFPLSPLPPLPSPWDGHLIHLTSWKDKYSLVECEAPASPLTQTGDEGKVSLSAELRRPSALIKSSTQPDTDVKMAAKTHTGSPFI